MELLVCAFAALTYLATLAFGFVYDDNPVIVNNAALRVSGGVHLGSILSGNVVLFRPVTALWTQTVYALFGPNPTGWHCASVALHVLATFLVFTVAGRLLGDRWAAFAAGLIFAVHPAHVENVAWVSAVNDLLMTVLLLSSFLAFLHARASRGRAWLALASGLFLAGLLAKETAVVFPLLVLSYAWLCSGEAGGDRLTRAGNAFRQSFVFFGTLAVYMVMRSLSVPGTAAPRHSAGDAIGWIAMVLTWPRVLWFDFRHLVFPLALSEFYPGKYVSQPAWGSFVLPVALLLGVAAGGWLGVRRLRQARLAEFACFWVLLPLAPTWYLRALTRNDFLHDRFLYFPSVGLALLVAIVLSELPLHAGRRIRAWGQGWLLALLVAAGATSAVVNEMPWASDLLLYRNGLKFVPDSSNLKDNLANVLADHGHTAEAMGLYREVLARDPGFWRSYYNLGRQYLRQDKNREAEQCLQQGIQVDDRDPDQFLLLAFAQWRQNKLPEAARNAELAIAKAPQAPGSHYLLGKILDAGGSRDQAIAEFRQEVANPSGNGAAREELRRLGALP